MKQDLTIGTVVVIPGSGEWIVSYTYLDIAAYDVVRVGGSNSSDFMIAWMPGQTEEQYKDELKKEPDVGPTLLL